jgi:hypothetical protein
MTLCYNLSLQGQNELMIITKRILKHGNENRADKNICGKDQATKGNTFYTHVHGE